MIEAIAIVVPAHNEAGTIGSIVTRCRNFGSFVLVVDDGSTDGTGRIAIAAGGKVISLPQQCGYGHALQLGFHQARQLGYEIVATLDGDGAHDPDFVPTLLDFHMTSHAELTIGSRFLSSETARSIPSPKVAANYFASHLINSALGASFTDVASGMRMLGRAALELRCRVSHFGFAYEHLAAAFRRRLRIAECSIPVRYNAERLFCTNRHELMDMLDAAARIVNPTEAPLQHTLGVLRENISARAVLRVVANGKYIVAHPVDEYDSYVFQFQEPCFVDRSTAEKWIKLN